MRNAVTILSVLLLSAMTAACAAAADTKTTFAIDATKSKVEIHVAKDGFLKAFGHDHLIAATQFSGQVHANTAKLEDSSVSFAVEAKALQVMDPGESEKDRSEVQKTMMGNEVLDVAHYPNIEFSSTAVKVISSASGKSELQVTGTLTLHGTQKPVTLPAHLQIADDGSLTCDTEISLLQSDFGIAPYKAAGGAVRVKDKLRLVFHIVALKSAN